MSRAGDDPHRAADHEHGSELSETQLRVRALESATSLSSTGKGSRVVVVGKLQQRSWTAEDGSARSLVEVVADELGPSL